MIRPHVLFAVLILLWVPASSLFAQTLVEWSAEAETASYNDADNWAGDIPSSFFREIASISNGGTAFLDDTAADEPGGVILGRLNVDRGGLVIRNNGVLISSRSEFDEVTGNVVVGQTGEGHLTVLPGGTLEAESLSSGGSVFSSIVLGEVGGTGTASVTINGAANLQRNTTLVGSNIDFGVQSLQLGGGHSLTQVITGNDHTPIGVAGTASLNGTLEVQFENYTPALGDSWDLIDAGVIAGDFRQLDASVDQFVPGAGLFVTQEAGGINGALYQLSVGPQLVLSVDRRTGQAAIENRTLTESIDLDGYLITSALDTMRLESWESFAGQGLSGWVESNPTASHLGELNLQSSLVVGPETSLPLGDIYAFTPTELGQLEPELSFEYHLTDGTTIPGRVDFTGLHNHIVLIVDPETGEAALQNQSPFDVEIDGYLITSTSGSLDLEGWISLEDSGQAGWTESNPSSNHLGELNLGDSIALQPVSGPVSIGTPFAADRADSLQDLDFAFHLAGGGTLTGVVEYGSLMSGDPLDCSGDGIVGSDDLACILQTGGANALEALLAATGLLPGDLDGNGEVAFADFLKLSQNFGTNVDSYTDGDIDGNGEVAFADFLKLSQNFGQSGGAAASIPEPHSWLLALIALVALCHARRPC